MLIGKGRGDGGCRMGLREGYIHSLKADKVI